MSVNVTVYYTNCTVLTVFDFFIVVVQQYDIRPLSRRSFNCTHALHSILNCCMRKFVGPLKTLLSVRKPLKLTKGWCKKGHRLP